MHRLHEQLVAKPPFVEPNEIKTLCTQFGGGPGCLTSPPNPYSYSTYALEIAPQLAYLQHNPGALNYFEPKTTFRFTVSRTF